MKPDFSPSVFTDTAKWLALKVVKVFIYSVDELGSELSAHKSISVPCGILTKMSYLVEPTGNYHYAC